MALKDDAFYVAVGLALFAGAAYYAKKRIGSAASSIAPYINPADSRNIVNQAAQSVYQGLTGSGSSIGAGIYDLFHTTPDITATTYPNASPVIQTVSNSGADLAASGYLDTGQFMGP